MAPLTRLIILSIIKLPHDCKKQQMKLYVVLFPQFSRSGYVLSTLTFFLTQQSIRLAPIGIHQIILSKAGRLTSILNKIRVSPSKASCNSMRQDSTQRIVCLA